MSARPPWLHFQRLGGSSPRDDEELTLAADGAFVARRTIGGRRIGSFEGQLSTAVLGRVRSVVDSAATAQDVAVPTPGHGATEVLEVGGRTLELGSNETPAKPWRALLKQVRELLQHEVLASPRRAVELVANARAARLDHVGDETLDVDVGSVTVQVIRVADDGTVLARWNGRAPGLVDNGERLVPTPSWATTGRGWSAPLPFDHGLDLAAGDMFQVWVGVPIRDAERARDGRLYVPVLADD